MDLSNELVNGRGYAVCPIENMHYFNKIRDSFVEKIEIPKKYKKNIDGVRAAFAKMTKAEINSTMISMLSFTDISEIMIKSCQNVVEALCGKELFIQRRAHTVINVPSSEHSKQWPHYELMSGISPFTYVLWAPLHDIEDDGGTYHIDQSTSIKVMEREQEEGLVNGPTVLNMMSDKKPARLKFGQVLVFNPFVLHGNVPYNSKYARIACNVRFQCSKDPLLQKNSDYLKYFRLS